MILRAGRINHDIKLQFETTMSFANRFATFQNNETAVLTYVKNAMM